MSLRRIKNCSLLLLLIFGIGLFAGKVGADTTLSVGTATLGVTHVNKAIPATDTSIYVGDTVTQTYPCTLNTSGTNSAGEECTVDSANWTWSIVSVSYSRDGSTFYPDGYQPSIGGGSTGTMTAIFPNDVNHPPGFWKITVHVHVDIVSSTCGNQSLGQDIGPYGFSVAKGDFGIGATLASPDIWLGGAGTASVTVTPLAGFNGTVSIDLRGGPAGVTGDAFSVSPVYPNPVQRGFNIYVSKTATPGTYPVLIVGTSGVLGHSAPLSINLLKRYVDISSGWDHTFYRTGGAPGSMPHNTAGIKTSNDSKILHNPVSADSVADWDGSYWRVLGGVFSAVPSNYRSYNWSYGGGTNCLSAQGNDGSAYPGSPATQYTAHFDAGNDPNGPKGSTTINVTAQTPEFAACSNSYTIKWHAPYETWTLNAQDPTFKTYQEIDPDDTTSYSIAGGSQNYTFHIENTYEGEFVSKSTAITLEVFSHYTPLEAIGSLLLALKVAIDAHNEETTIPSQGKAFTQELWENALKGTAGDARFVGTPPTWAQYQAHPGIAGIWGQYHMKAVMRVDYVTSSYSCAHYGATGFDTDMPQSKTQYSGTEGMLGIIYKDTTTPPGG